MKIQRNAVMWLCCVMAAGMMGAMSASMLWAEENLLANRFLAGPLQGSMLLANSAGADTGIDDDFSLLEEPDNTQPKAIHVADPLEPLNRAMYVFNDKCYFWLLKPVARGYKAVVPTFFRECIQNFFNNLGTPMRMANCLLQAKGKRALSEFDRFLCNSTIGVLGFGNPARKYPDLNPDPEDLGQTLGVYGVGHGIYLVLPILGPSSLRDLAGLGGDYFLKPTSYIEPMAASIAVSAEERINYTSLRLGDYETFKENAFEPYIAARNAYLQFRQGKVEK